MGRFVAFAGVPTVCHLEGTPHKERPKARLADGIHLELPCINVAQLIHIHPEILVVELIRHHSRVVYVEHGSLNHVDTSHEMHLIDVLSVGTVLQFVHTIKRSFAVYPVVYGVHKIAYVIDDKLSVVAHLVHILPYVVESENVTLELLRILQESFILIFCLDNNLTELQYLLVSSE